MGRPAQATASSRSICRCSRPKSAAAVLAASIFLFSTACSSDKPDFGPSYDSGAKEGVPAKVASDLAEREKASGDVVSAVALYRRALVMDPNQPKVAVSLGDALIETGASAEASDVFRGVLAKSPKNAEAMTGLGIALVRLGQTAPAAEILHKALDLMPTARGYRALGVADSLLGRSQAAVEDFTKGVAVAPQDVSLRSNLGLAQAIAGDFTPALVNLRAAAASPGSTPQYRQNLALGFGLAGRTDEAAEIARIDLDATAVRSNLAFYSRLRTMAPDQRAQALMRNGTAPSAASGANE